MSLVEHAKAEFRAAGWCDENGVFIDEMQHMICDNAIELLTIFGEQGHSGSSAPYLLNIFDRLAKWEPIVPLTGEDWEWNDTGHGVLQNKRCSRVFKDTDGRAYDIDGRVFWEWCKPYDDREPFEPYKSYYTSRDSRVYIEFPYIVPEKPEYVYRHSDADPQQPAQNEQGFIE